jgi:Na+-translocating ferredoxin:NAD+ oxidoreductase subunit G
MVEIIQTDRAAPPASWPMYRALVGIGMLCGLLIVSVYVLTGPVIARNEARALEAAVFRVLPGATRSHTFALTEDGRFRSAEEGTPTDSEAEAGTPTYSGMEAGTNTGTPIDSGDPELEKQAGTPTDRVVHAGYDDNGSLVGVAIQAQGMGYQDVIRVLYGYDPARDAIIGMQVLASKETPGLGDKIEKDPAFLANFDALDVSLAPDGQSLQHPIEAVKGGEKSQPWQIDGITGATISSKAIAGTLRESSAQWVPLIHRQRAIFTDREVSND